MSQNHQPSAIPTGLRQGWLFGFIMLGIYLLYLIVDRASGFPARFLLLQGVDGTVLSYAIAAVLMLIAAIVFLIGGIMASAKTGRASSGWIAGQFGGLVYGIGSVLVYGILLFGFVLPSEGIAGYPDLYWMEVRSDISNQMLTIVLFGGVFMGNLAGVIGGLLGRGRGRRRLSFSGD